MGASSKRITAERKAAGLCTRCGLIPPAPDHTKCYGCLEDCNTIAARHREKLRQGGQCLRCAAPLDREGAECSTCLIIRADEQKPKQMQRYYKKRAQGKCTRCGRPSEKTLCLVCVDMQASYKRNMEAKRREQGLCPNCGRKPLPGKVSCVVCLETWRERYHKRRARAAAQEA